MYIALVRYFDQSRNTELFDHRMVYKIGDDTFCQVLFKYRPHSDTEH